MTEKIIDEVMGLADDLALKTDAYLNGEASKDEMLAARRALKTKLRELLVRKPLDYHTISMAHLDIGAVGQLNATERIVRWTERAHGIGS